MTKDVNKIKVKTGSITILKLKRLNESESYVRKSKKPLSWKGMTKYTKREISDMYLLQKVYM